MLRAIWTVAGTLGVAFVLWKLVVFLGGEAVGRFIGDDPPSANNDSGLVK